MEVNQRCLKTQFNSIPIILTTGLSETTPQYVVITLLVLAFVIVLGIFGIAFFYIHRKYKSIDNHTDKKYSLNNDKDGNNITNTYKEDKKSYKKDVSDLGANTLPDGQTIVSIVGKIVPFIKKK